MVTQSRTEVLPQSVRSQGPIQAQGPAPRKQVPYVTGPIVRGALADAFRKLDPRVQVRNPVMFVVFAGSIFTTFTGIGAALGYFRSEGPPGFILAVAVWLWLTVLFANFAEAIAEGRGKAQAETLRSMRRHVVAKRLKRGSSTEYDLVEAGALRRGDLVVVETNDIIPADGEIVEGVASVNESAVTGESAPVLREAGGDFSSVTGGTRVLSDRIVVSVTSKEGEGFLDRMIAMVEGAKRGRTPNEIALTILLAMMTLVFLLATATLAPFSRFAVNAAGQGSVISLTVLIALLVCLIPTTIGALLSAIGIAGMDRMVRANVIATSGRAVEAAGDVDVLLLDKTGTITLGDRQAYAFIPAPGVTEQELADAAQLASLADETPEGRSIVVLAKQKFQLRGRDLASTAHVLPQVLGADAHERRRSRGPTAAQGGGRRDPQVHRGSRRHVAREGQRGRRFDRAHRRHADRRGGRPQGARRDRAARHRQGRHSRALRRAAADGYQDDHGHRRQPADRGRHRRRGRRRRLSRRGDTGAQARADPATTRRRAGWSPCAATARTTRPRSRRPMSRSR